MRNRAQRKSLAEYDLRDHDVLDRLPLGQFDRPALVRDVFRFGIDADRGTQGGQYVRHIDLAVFNFLPAVAGLAVGLAPLDAAAGEDARPSLREMIAARLRIDFGGAAELADPQDGRRIQEIALGQLLHQRAPTVVELS